MSLSDYLPDFQDPNQMALFGALGNILVQGGTPRPGTGMGIGNRLAMLGGAGLQGMQEGANAAQKYTSGQQSNELNNYNLMYYRKMNGLDPNTGQPLADQSTASPFGSISPAQQVAPQQAAAMPQPLQTPSPIPAQQTVQPINASQLNAPAQGGIPNPPSPGTFPPDMKGNGPVFGAINGGGGVNGLPYLPPALAGAMGPLISYQENIAKTGMKVAPDGSVQVVPGAPQAAATMSQATESGKVAPTIAIQNARIAAENASQKDIESYKNYLEFGDNGMGGKGSILPAMSQGGANGGQPIKSEHGTMIPDVTQQSPIPRDSASLKSAIPAWQEKAGTITDMVQPAQKAQVQLAAIANALKETQSGSFATNKANIKAALDAGGIKLPDSVWGSPADVQVAMHGAQLETLSDLKAANTRFSQMEFKTIIANKENPNTQPAANLEFLAQDMGAINQQLALANDWRAAQKMGWRNPQDFASAWMAQNPQSKFVAGAKAKIGLLKGMQAQ